MLNRMVGYWNTVDWPEDIRAINKSWRTYGPENIIVYHFESAVRFIDEFYGARELDAFKACAIPAMQSDLFRVLEIYKNGGFYMDLGIELLRSPLEFMSPEREIILYRRWHGRIVNNIFSAKPYNPILSMIKEKILNNIEARVANDVWHVTGPKVWNDATDTGRLSEGIKIIDHKDIAGKTVIFHQKLHHKSGGRHWSDTQKSYSIFN